MFYIFLSKEHFFFFNFENLNFSLQELLGLVQLDVRSIDLFDMPPMTEYELYMKRFGSSDTRQVCMI